MRRALLLALLLLAPTAWGAVGTAAVDVMSDGFVVRYHLAGTGLYPDADTGVLLDLVRDATRDNYEAFLSWGLRGGWPGEGHVWVDDARAAQCVACVVSGPDFQVHVSLTNGPRTSVPSRTFYPDEEGRVRTIVGHEVFHNFQNARVQPAPGARMVPAFQEGLARMQETLHDYSSASHQPLSLIYTGNVNGCNNELAPEPRPVAFPEGSPVRFVPDARLSDGPATDQSYSACSFWLAWVGAHGRAGLVALLEEAPRHKEKDGWQEMRDLLENVTGAPEDDLARYAALALTGQGALLDGRDWGAYLGRWQPAALAAGEARTERLADGGMMAARVADGARVHGTSDAPIALYHVDDAGSVTRVADGTILGSGWAVAVLPGVGSADVTIAVA